MAFNPFTWFRKHQKVLFAGLTILCMIVFIGQFVRDVFTRALAYFGAGRASGQPVTTLYGKTVREGDIERIGFHRRLASDFLFGIAWESHQRVCKDLLDGQLKSTAPDNPLSGLREIVTSAQQRAGIGLLTLAFRTPMPAVREMILSELNRLEEIAARDKVRDDPERLALLQRVATILGFQFWLAEPNRIRQAAAFFESQRRVYPRDFYFGGGDKVEDMLDFRLWQHQADKLGIKLTNQDVIREVVAEAAGASVFEAKMPFENDRRVLDFLATSRDAARAKPQDLLDALREEFRVVMAQAMMLGSEPGARAYRMAMGVTSSPALATPDEFLNYFREQRTSLRVKFLTIPVTQFLDKVKDSPTDQELRTRYEQFREQEPNRATRAPGFKEPRRIVTQYVVASPADPYYRNLGKAKILAWAVNSITAADPLGILTSVVADPIREVYDRELKENDPAWYYNPRDSLSMLADRSKKLHLTSVIRPSAIGSLVAGLTTGSPVQAISNLIANATEEEVRVQARFALTQLLAQSNPQTLLGDAALIAAALPQPPSRNLLEPQILASLEERISETELRDNLTKLREELAKFRGRANGAKDYLTKAVKDYHLQLFTMPTPMTRDGILNALKSNQDLQLGLLKDAILKLTRTDRLDVFVEDLFMRNGTYEALPFSVTDPKRQEFVFWRSEDLPARTREFADVRSEVEMAWKMERARQLARDEAIRIESEINNGKLSKEDAVALLNKQTLGPVFELDDIAQLIPPREVLAARRTEYSPYQVPEDKGDLLEFPPEDFAKQLLTLTRTGQATVVVDQPGRNFYVAVLLNRDEPKMEKFLEVYRRTPREDSLYTMFLAQRREDYRKSILEQLRRDAGEIDKDGGFKIPDAIRRRDNQAME